MTRLELSDLKVEFFLLAIVLYAFALLFLIPVSRTLIIHAFAEFQRISTGGFSTVPTGSDELRPLVFGYILVIFGTLSLLISLFPQTREFLDEWERENL